ncbi:anti-sigma factor domain-containing protein [Flavobacterium sp. NRK F7]|uniref:anti-sigma factor n=1 Tax=Flavobacterium sp. NRK F7 TaxID=2954930 RepID=UPI0020900C41|nr:anti-sigma factor [Flavobacterium sp. NRK F7]MCO6163741.1 anti-sigma factor [Flavobacterium sp. NRK F7]
MNSRELIESGTLELFVFGKLTEEENKNVIDMAKKHPEVQEEILAIENAVINLSQSVAPHLSATNYEKIRQKILGKNGVIALQRKPSWTNYIGWAAAAIFVIGFGFQYLKWNDSQTTIEQLSTEKSNMQRLIVDLELEKQEAEKVLAIVRDNNNIQVALGGQEVAPNAYAKAYYNKETKEVYIDASGLPTPPEGKVYQVWGLKLDPLTPKSIGLLNDFASNSTKVFKVDKAEEAEAFGITLEPAGGSQSPTLEQLYTLGKV